MIADDIRVMLQASTAENSRRGGIELAAEVAATIEALLDA